MTTERKPVERQFTQDRTAMANGARARVLASDDLTLTPRGNPEPRVSLPMDHAEGEARRR